VGVVGEEREERMRFISNGGRIWRQELVMRRREDFRTWLRSRDRGRVDSWRVELASRIDAGAAAAADDDDGEVLVGCGGRGIRRSSGTDASLFLINGMTPSP
jgi:hypothetical protein